MGTILRKNYLTNGLRIVSLFEAAKGLLVLLAGLGLLAFIHKDLHSAVEELVRYFHFYPARRYPKIFISAINHLTDVELNIMAISALLYSVIRFIEAYGLWLQRRWAAWFGVLSGSMYLPLELLEILRGVTWQKVTVLVVNAGIVAYLAVKLYQSKEND